MKRVLSLLLCVVLIFSFASCEYIEYIRDEYFGDSVIESSGISESQSVEEKSYEVSESTAKDTVVCRILDIGQGDSILISFSDGNSILIDAGVYNNKNAVLDKLDELNVVNIEYFVLTHPDADHIGASSEVIENHTVKNVIMTEATSTSKTFSNLLSTLEKHEEINIIPGYSDTEFEYGGAYFKILSPENAEAADTNETSIVIMMTYGETKMLFMGDASTDNEEAIINKYGASYIKADVIKLGHHGSSTSSSTAFLKAVSPGYALISCGLDNKYGHPHTETINRLKQLKIPYFRTDYQGTVTVKTDGKTVEIETEKNYKSDSESQPTA